MARRGRVQVPLVPSVLTISITMLIISNPVAGDKRGSLFLKEHVIPLLIRHTSSGLPIDFEETHAPGDAGSIAARYLKGITAETAKEDPVIVISGGDTTIKELVNGITGIKQPASVIIVPSGTANALYHSLFPPKGHEAFIQQLASPIQEDADSIPEDVNSKLFAVFSFLSGGTKKRLYSTRTEILDANAKVINGIVSCVVVSSSLHASILDIAESLRDAHPGIERFKIAAAQSITQWSDARLVVKYPYQVYDTRLGTFRTLESQTNDKVTAEYAGPFAYFLTTTNVDRLERDFRITPLATSVQFTDDAVDRGWMEVLMIRPTNHISSDLVGSDESTREEFAATTVKVLQAAYNNGSHLQATYDKNATSVVEYLRVREWEWVPHKDSVPAHLICVDGEILHVPEGGKAMVRLLSREDRPELSVYGGQLH